MFCLVAPFEPELFDVVSQRKRRMGCKMYISGLCYKESKETFQSLPTKKTSLAAGCASLVIFKDHCCLMSLPHSATSTSLEDFKQHLIFHSQTSSNKARAPALSPAL